MNRGLQAVTDFSKKHYYLLTALLMFLSFPSYDFWFLKGFAFFAWFSLAPLFLFVRGRSMKQVFAYSFLTGLAGNLLTYNWIGNFGAVVEGGYAVVLAFLIPALTGFFVTRILIAEFLSRRFERLRAVIYPAVWICVDWIQSLGSLAFPWTYWGYSQYPFTALVQMASVTGVMGVSFLVVFANCLVSDHLLIMRDKGLGFMKSFAEATGKRLAALAAAVALIAVAGGVVMLAGGRASHSDMRVAMVQSCINPWDNWSINRMHYLQELTRLTNRALDQNPDMLVWSESATLELISHSFQTGRLNSFERQLFDFVARVGKPLLTGEIGRSYNMARFEPRFHNSAVLIDGAGNVVRSYYKINLVPFGEWFPYERWFPWVSRLVQSFGASSFSPGSGPVRFEALGRKFGVLICYEGIFFRLCRQYKRLGVDFLVNITNDGWTDTYNGHMQHYAASKFRAIENGLWLLRAGNTGYTVFIDPYGRETASIPILHKGYLVGSMDFTLNHATFYSIAGDAFFYLVAAFVGGLLLLLARRRMHERFARAAMR